MITSPESVRIQREADALNNEYCKAYELRYGSRPFITEESQAIMRWATIHLQFKARELIAHYLTMHDQWFLDNAHSLRVFKKDINKVIAAHGLKSRANRVNDLKIRTRSQCPSCQALFLIECWASEVERKLYAVLCESCISHDDLEKRGL